MMRPHLRWQFGGIISAHQSNEDRHAPIRLACLGARQSEWLTIVVTGCLLARNRLTAIGFQPRRKSPPHRVFAHGSWLDELQQIVFPAGFGADARHSEAAEWLPA